METKLGVDVQGLDKSKHVQSCSQPAALHNDMVIETKTARHMKGTLLRHYLVLYSN